MSKKSYKQLQNRLYRETKRRMIAENTAYRTIYRIERLEVDTLKIEYLTPYFGEGENEGCDKGEHLSNLEKNMARKIAQKLLEDGYIEKTVLKSKFEGDYPPLPAIKIVMKLRVVKPQELNEECISKEGR